MSAPTTATDSELFSALRRGEASALDELFRRHYARLCRTAVRMLRDEASAEDVVQEFFTSLWTKREGLPSEPPAAVGAYLSRAVRNRSLNYLRDRNRIPIDDGELPPDLATPAQGVASLEREELQARIERAIDRLPERCRLIFVMNKVEDMSHREIAEGLGISTKTVENQMTRAYKFLREYLAALAHLIILFHYA